MKVAMPSQYNTIQLVQAQLDTIKSEEIPPPKKKQLLLTEVTNQADANYTQRKTEYLF